MPRVWSWAQKHGASLFLILTGLLMVAAAIWVVPDRGAVAAPLVVIGGGAVILGALLPRVEGLVTFGWRGFSFYVLAVQEAVRRIGGEQGLPPLQIQAAERQVVIDMAVARPFTVAGRAAIPTAKVDAIAAEAIAKAQAEDAKEPGTEPDGAGR